MAVPGSPALQTKPAQIAWEAAPLISGDRCVARSNRLWFAKLPPAMTHPSRQPRSRILNLACKAAGATLHRFLEGIPAWFRQKTTKASIAHNLATGSTYRVSPGRTRLAIVRVAKNP